MAAASVWSFTETKQPTLTLPAAYGELRIIYGELYLVCEDRIYIYEPLTEGPGAYVGRLLADEKTIDMSKPDWTLQIPEPEPEPTNTGSLITIDGEEYYIIDKDVYAYDPLSGMIGQLVGHLLENGTIHRT